MVKARRPKGIDSKSRASKSAAASEKIALSTRLRNIVALILLTGIGLPTLYQSSIDGLYDILRHNSFYGSSVFETVYTVLLYAIVEPSLTVVFLRHPEWRLAVQEEEQEAVAAAAVNKRNGAGVGSDVRGAAGAPEAALSPRRKQKPKGMRRPSRRLIEGLIYVAPLLLMDLTMIKKYAGTSLEAKLASGNYDIDLFLQQQNIGAATVETINVTTTATATISNTDTNDNAMGKNRRYYDTFLIPSLHNMTLQSPLQTTRALPPFAPSSRRILLELLGSFFIYDFVFFLFHLALHTIPVLRTTHAKHHRHGELQPQITNQLSISERLGLVMLANLSLNCIGSHVLTRTAFVPIFIWLLVELHCGLDLPWGYEKVLPAGWAGGARKHALHHRKGVEVGGFEPFFSWWDGLLDFVMGRRAR